MTGRRIYCEAVMLLVAFLGINGQAKAFEIFDGTSYKNKPNLVAYGIHRIEIVGADEIWGYRKTSQNLPTRLQVIDAVRDAASRLLYEEKRTRVLEGAEIRTPIVLDIEHWDVKGDGAIVDENIAKYIQILEWGRDVGKGVRMGYYGIPPIRDYWRAIKPTNHTDNIRWKFENNRLMPLAEKVDALFPSLYTFYADRDGWVNYAIANLAEARRLSGGKPVYVFLWPQYHESNRVLAGRYIEREYWRLQLETVRKYADGLVIWGGWGEGGRKMWDDSADWWMETKAFIGRLQDGHMNEPMQTLHPER